MHFKKKKRCVCVTFWCLFAYIVAVIFSPVFDECVTLMRVRHAILGNVDVHHRSSLHKNLPHNLFRHLRGWLCRHGRTGEKGERGASSAAARGGASAVRDETMREKSAH